MAKSIYKESEVKNNRNIYKIDLTKDFTPAEEVIEIDDSSSYTGPTIDDLKKEADEFRKNFEAEKQAMLATAQAEADKIIKDAEKAAFNEVKKQSDDAQVINQKAIDNANSIVSEAEKKAHDILSEAEAKRDEKQKEAYTEGFNAGRESGYKEGEAEVQRLIDRLHLIITKTLDRREAILAETEQQIVDLVLLMTRKVVKVISENQRNVVVSNIVHALRKVKGRGDVTIRVNLVDLALTSEHIKNFLTTAENVNNITVVEDSTVDAGGCIVETDFGAIDARISSQLNELEQKILEISPIKTKLKTGGSL